MKVMGVDPADIIKSPSGKVSHTRLASSTSYAVGVFCFIKFHLWLFDPVTDVVKVQAALSILPMMWLFFFGIVASHQAANKLIALKWGDGGKSGAFETQGSGKDPE